MLQCGEGILSIQSLLLLRQRLARLKEPDNEIQKNVRSQRRKVCVYCGKQFWVKTAAQTCSAYCKKKHQMLRKCQNELNAKQKKLNKLQAERDDYRKQVVADFQKT